MLGIEQERLCHQRWGWTNVPAPIPPTAFNVPVSMEIHGTLECDDCLENLWMWERTGIENYLTLARAWHDYYMDPARYLADLQNDSFQQHTFGWGLVRWAAIFGDHGELAAVERIAAHIEPKWVTPTGGETGFYGIRGPARQLHLVALLAHATQAPRWATLRDRILSVLMESGWWWDERGFVTQGDWGTNQQFGPGTYERHARQISTLLSGIFATAALATLRVFPHAELERRLRKFAAWAKVNALHPVHQQSGSGMLVEADQSIAYVHFDNRPSVIWEPAYTSYWCNALVYAGEVETAAKFWDRSVRGVQGDVAARGQGYFANGSYLGGSVQFPGDGVLQYVGDLFPAVVGAPPTPLPTPTPTPPPIPMETNMWTQIPNSQLATRVQQYGAGPDGLLSYGGFALVVLDGTPWILFLGAGGHSAWGPSLVAGFPLTTGVPVWQVFNEPPPVQLAENLPDHEYRTDGKLVAPPAAHLYNGTQGLPGGLAIRYGGSLWSEVTGNDPRIYLYDMKTRVYTRGPDIPGAQGWSNPGSCSAVDPKTGEFVVWELWGLFAYNPTAKTWRKLSMIGRGGEPNDAYRTACIDPIRREFLSLGGGKFRAISLETGTPRDITLTGDGAWIKDAGAPGLEWDPELGKAVAWFNEVVVVDPVAGTATKVLTQGTKPAPARQEGVYGAFRRYAPGKYVVMTMTTQPISLLTLTLTAGPGPTPVPPQEGRMKPIYVGTTKGTLAKEIAKVGETIPRALTLIDNFALYIEAPAGMKPTNLKVTSSPSNGWWQWPGDSMHWGLDVVEAPGGWKVSGAAFEADRVFQVEAWWPDDTHEGPVAAVAGAIPAPPVVTPPVVIPPVVVPPGMSVADALAKAQLWVDEARTAAKTDIAAVRKEMADLKAALKGALG